MSVSTSDPSSIRRLTSTPKWRDDPRQSGPPLSGRSVVFCFCTKRPITPEELQNLQQSVEAAPSVVRHRVEITHRVNLMRAAAKQSLVRVLTAAVLDDLDLVDGAAEDDGNPGSVEGLTTR